MSDEVCSEIGLTQNWTNSKIRLPHKSGQKVFIMSDRVCSEIGTNSPIGLTHKSGQKVSLMSVANYI